MAGLTDLPNIGEKLAAQLERAGIATPRQLMEAGSEQAWLGIQQNDPSACLHRLQALEGAVQGVRKAQLDEESRARLRAFFQAHKVGAAR